MKTFVDTVNSLWRVLVIALIFGAALPAVFAYGVRFLSLETIDENGAVRRRSTLSIIAGLVCMAIVVAAIAAGILFVMKDFLATRFGVHAF